ncbi:outer membrane beta-barrel protein [uncultured Aquabacterium sp.]|uniref:outer membrane beta-barrel protein n=1 Tax=uncultured Aquabacterium sp. TaxID=158753 RepID=UPI0030CF10FA
MNASRNMKAVALAALLLALTGTASAQWYGGVAGGQARVDLGCDAPLRCEETSPGYKLTLGYRTDTVFAVEAAYLNAGRNKITDETDNLDLRPKGFLLGVALRGAVLPELRVVGRFGLAMLAPVSRGASLAAGSARATTASSPILASASSTRSRHSSS